MSKTLYITDLDGTLLNNESRISDTSKEILTELSSCGKLISVATARTPATVDPLLAGTPLNLPAIVITGAARWDLKQKCYEYVHEMDTDLCSMVENICKLNNIIPLRYTLPRKDFLEVYRMAYGDTGMTRAERSFIEERRKLPLKHFTFHPKADGDYGPTLLYLCFAPITDVYKAAGEMRQQGIDSVSAYPDIFSPETGILEVYARGVSKAAAVVELKQQTGAERLVVFGDNLNDLPMLRVADVAVAVDNALPEVKDAADIVIGPNMTDSVARFIAADSSK